MDQPTDRFRAEWAIRELIIGSKSLGGGRHIFEGYTLSLSISLSSVCLSLSLFVVAMR
jgi:hypothetical protein